MKPTPTSLASTRWTNIVLIVLFMGMLWLPTLDTFFHLDHASAFNEKRQMAGWPQLKPGLAGLKTYLAGLEAWFNDHFGFRKCLIHWHVQWQLEFFNGGRSNAMMGRDGWLFFNENMMQLVGNYQGTLQFLPQELANLQKIQEHRRDWLALRGIEYIFIVAPDKQSIYPEYLPSWLTPVRHHTKLDQFVDYMRTHSTVTILDLRPALRDAKRIAPTYYRTDSHWNSFGGFVACQEIERALAKKIPGLEPLALDSFEFEKAQKTNADLSTLLGVFASEDTIKLTPKTNLPPLVETIQNPEFTVPTYFTSNASAKGACLVFRDSFGPALQPFLGYHFQKVSYFWGPDGFDTNIIQQINPTVVISEIVERHFDDAGQKKPPFHQ